MADYNNKMRVVFYTETKEVEVLEERPEGNLYKYPSLLHFHSLNDLAALLKTLPRAQLQELLALLVYPHPQLIDKAEHLDLLRELAAKGAL